jgi:glutamyl/glutaminyl-tRNA synthetase
LSPDSNSHPYRGRLAPSPTGLLHLGHARTFWIAAQRAHEHGGKLILRNEYLDASRCRAEFVDAMFEDLRWLGIAWQEGPDCGGPFAPYSQSERQDHYRNAWNILREQGFIYPCTCSRKEVAQSASAPNDLDDEPVYPGTCRPRTPGKDDTNKDGDEDKDVATAASPVPRRRSRAVSSTQANWRFRVPDGEEISFTDLHLGPQCITAGRDFGDFIVWRRDDVPAYQLAVVADDAAMRITEVVRGADLLKSTARQLLLFRALGFTPPQYYHCDLLRDENGVRLAKRHDSLSIHRLRELGWTPDQVRTSNPPTAIRQVMF